MPIPEYMRKMGSEVLCDTHAQNRLNFAKESNFVNTDHVHTRVGMYPMENDCMSTCIFHLDEKGSLLLWLVFRI